jgi:hypothetical protein
MSIFGSFRRLELYDGILCSRYRYAVYPFLPHKKPVRKTIPVGAGPEPGIKSNWGDLYPLSSDQIITDSNVFDTFFHSFQFYCLITGLAPPIAAPDTDKAKILYRFPPSLH